MKLIPTALLLLNILTSLASAQGYNLRIKLHNGTTASFRVDSIRALTFSGTTSAKEIKEISLLPEILSVFQNYPNPFNPSTKITYRLTKGSNIEIEVFSTTGERVRTLQSGFQQPGEKTVNWDGKNNEGMPVASGAYLYRVRVDGVVQTRKMLFVK